MNLRLLSQDVNIYSDPQEGQKIWSMKKDEEKIIFLKTLTI